MTTMLRSIGRLPLVRPASRHFSTSSRALASEKPGSTSSPQNQQKDSSAAGTQAQEAASKPKPRKTQAQLDQELQQKMAGIAGDGGEAGIELEDGQPVSMKRSVKNNMFRYI